MTSPIRLAFAHCCLAGLLSVAALAQPPATTVEVATGFSSAIGGTHAPDGSGRIFVVQQTGQIRIWTGTAVLPTPFLDLSSLVSNGGEQGLLGLAFHPNYAANGHFYVNYTDTVGDTVIARYTVSAGNPNVANPASATPVLDFDQPFGNHNGGDMHFGPDGYLYISSGDGGDAFEGQNLSSLLGNILRIDVDGDDFPGDPDRNYAIPAGNPFVGTAGAAEEIWAWGLRNPWRFSIDRQTGDLFIGDVGEGDREEIDFLPAGVGGINLGWPCYEGSLPFFDQDPVCTGGGPYTFPIAELPRSAPPNNNCSIIGGFRYRGHLFSRLQGWYFFSDWCTGQLWAAEPDAEGTTWTSHFIENIGTFSYTGYAEGQDGELYVVGGFSLLQVVDVDGPDPFFGDGFETGNAGAWDAVVPGGP